MDKLDALEILQRLRLGAVLRPEQMEQEAQGLKQRPKFDGYGLHATVPNWLVSELESSDAPARQLKLLSAEVHPDHLLFLTVQSRTAQLRVMLQLSDPAVQQFVVDSMRRGRLQLLLALENTTQFVRMSLPVDFSSVEPVIQDAIHSSRLSVATVRWLLRTSCAAAEPTAVPSLVAGQTVADVVTVVVMNEELLLRHHASLDRQAQAVAPGSAMH